MKIQQHNGVVVDAAELRQGFAKLYGGGRGVGEGEGGTKGMGAAALPAPSLYRAPRGAPALGDAIS